MKYECAVLGQHKEEIPENCSSLRLYIRISLGPDEIWQKRKYACIARSHITTHPVVIVPTSSNTDKATAYHQSAKMCHIYHPAGSMCIIVKRNKKEISSHLLLVLESRQWTAKAHHNHSQPTKHSIPLTFPLPPPHPSRQATRMNPYYIVKSAIINHRHRLTKVCQAVKQYSRMGGNITNR